MENHVNWPTAMGARVLINDGWYQVDFRKRRSGRLALIIG